MSRESEGDREQKNKSIYDLNVKMIKDAEKGKIKWDSEQLVAPPAARPCLPLSLAVALLLGGPSGLTVAATMVTIPRGNKCWF